MLITQRPHTPLSMCFQCVLEINVQDDHWPHLDEEKPCCCGCLFGVQCLPIPREEGSTGWGEKKTPRGFHVHEYVGRKGLCLFGCASKQCILCGPTCCPFVRSSPPRSHNKKSGEATISTSSDRVAGKNYNPSTPPNGAPRPGSRSGPPVLERSPRRCTM